MDGHPLRGTLLPPRVVLYRRALASYRRDGHAHKVNVDGRVGELAGVIYHDDRKPFARWKASQMSYMPLEAEKLRSTAFGALSFPDKVRRLVIVAPFVVAVYCLFVKGLILDGPRGWYYVYQRMLAEFLLSLALLRHMFRLSQKG